MLKHYKFSDVEIAKILNESVILIDTREKDTFQKRLFKEYCASCQIKTDEMKLPFGDYGIKVPAMPELGIMRAMYMPFVVERKANLDELCVNFSSKDRNRFLKEQRERVANTSALKLEIIKAIKNDAPQDQVMQMLIECVSIATSDKAFKDMCQKS